MKTILGTIEGKPSNALQAMYDGLLKQDRRIDFVVNFRFFGGVLSDRVCFGCAATCTLQEISQVDLNPGNITLVEKRARAYGFEQTETIRFEMAMDCARHGNLYDLFGFCGLDCRESYCFMDGISMLAKNWKRQMPRLKKLIAGLKQAGY